MTVPRYLPSLVFYAVLAGCWAALVVFLVEVSPGTTRAPAFETSQPLASETAGKRAA